MASAPFVQAADSAEDANVSAHVGIDMPLKSPEESSPHGNESKPVQECKEEDVNLHLEDILEAQLPFLSLSNEADAPREAVAMIACAMCCVLTGLVAAQGATGAAAAASLTSH